MDGYIQTQLSSIVDSFSVSLLILKHFLNGKEEGGGGSLLMAFQSNGSIEISHAVLRII